MQIANPTVLITGANRGIGLAFAKAFLERGARKVYAGARDPSKVSLHGVTPLRLDVNSGADVQAAAQLASDATIVVNNAGIARFGSLLVDDAEELLRGHLETNLFGVLRVSRAFAPVLARNGSVSNGLRNDLRAQGTQVLTLHMGFVDTDLTRGIEMPKAKPEAIVDRALSALEAGAHEVLADEMTQQVKNSLSAEQAVYLAAR